MKNLRETNEGLILSIKVTPSAKKNEIVGWKAGLLRVRVTESPEKGEANRAVIRLLARTFRLTQNKIVLLQGAYGKEKEVLLMGYTLLEFESLSFKEK